MFSQCNNWLYALEQVTSRPCLCQQNCGDETASPSNLMSGMDGFYISIKKSETKEKVYDLHLSQCCILCERQ